MSEREKRTSAASGSTSRVEALPPAVVIERLSPFLTEPRKERIEHVLAGRTHTVATVVEGLINQGNISAVMRSAEALGFHRFHVIEAQGHFKRSSRTSQGADKWLDITRWETPDACVESLREAGYRIAVTHLSPDAVPIDTLDFTRKTALVLGNEQHGVSERMRELADTCCMIPMLGFTQSFNISVAAAVSLYHAFQDRVRRQGRQGDLTEAERDALRARYYALSVKNADALLAGSD
ncbi:MAG: RNA methyltransferase [Rhodothermales bacterium]